MVCRTLSSVVALHTLCLFAGLITGQAERVTLVLLCVLAVGVFQALNAAIGLITYAAGAVAVLHASHTLVRGGVANRTTGTVGVASTASDARV